jgi:hypothetical protein
MVYRPACKGGDRQGRRALIVCSCYTTGTNVPGTVVSLFVDVGVEGARRTRAVSSGSTVQSICRISRWENSAQSGSSVHGGGAKHELRKACMSCTRGPLPWFMMIGLERRMSVGSSRGP